MPAAARPPVPEVPHVWRARDLACAVEKTVPTGHPALDEQLPAGGWPLGSLIEILQQHAEQHVWQLLVPGLVQAVRAQPGPVVLVHPPYLPFTPGLRGQGLLREQLLCVHAEKPAARLWAAEQALRCSDVGAVLAWLPQARSDDLRRLHLCAQQQGSFLVVFRELAARTQASPARLRLVLQGAGQLEVLILKRRGPPLLLPLVLPAQPPRLAGLLAARKGRRSGLPAPAATLQGASHALDRTAALAR